MLNSVIYQVMVGRGGLEPPTSRLSGVRSNQLSYRPIIWASLTARNWLRQSLSRHSIQNELNVGGAYRDRTDDPLLAKQVLSQLS